MLSKLRSFRSNEKQLPPNSSWEVLKLIWSLNNRYPKLFWQSSLMYPFGQTFQSIVVPYVLALVTDKVVGMYGGSTRPPVGLSLLALAPYILAMVIIAYIGRELALKGSILGFRLRSTVWPILEQEVFGPLLAKDPQFHEDNQSAEVISRLHQLETSYTTLSFQWTSSFLNLSLKFLVAIVLCFFNSWELGCFLFGWSIAVIWLSYIQASKRMGPAKRGAEAATSVTALVGDVITCIDPTRSYTRESAELASHKEKVDLHRKLKDELIDLTEKFGRTFAQVNTLAHLAVVGGGIVLVAFGDLSVGGWGFVLNLFIQLELSLAGIGSVIFNSQEGIADAAKAIEMINSPIKVIDPENPQEPQFDAGGVKISEVTFRYPTDQPVESDAELPPAILDDITIDIPAGTHVGIVGPSGSGKSTVTKLVRRSYDPTDGAIEFDGQDIRCVRKSEIHRFVGAVTQETHIYNRSVFDNVRVAKEDATMEEVIKACEAAQAHEFIMRKPQGYDTVVGEGGIKLSGGERQRIAIARVILKNPKILILDEATASLDTLAERVIQQQLDNLSKGRTTITIAHRLSTIVGSDMIYVLDRGKIVESGNHETLLEQDGLYARLWREQQPSNLRRLSLAAS